MEVLNPDGSKRWSAPLSPSRHALAMDGTVYVLGGNDFTYHTVCAYDNRGVKKWEYDCRLDFPEADYKKVANGVSSIARDGTVYALVEAVPGKDEMPTGAILALTPQGTKKGLVDVPELRFEGDPGEGLFPLLTVNNPAISSSGALYIVILGGALLKVAPDGTVKQLLAETRSQPVIDARDRVYIIDDSGRMVMINPDDSMKQTDLHLCSFLPYWLAIGGNGIIYAASRDELVAIGSK